MQYILGYFAWGYNISGDTKYPVTPCIYTPSEWMLVLRMQKFGEVKLYKEEVNTILLTCSLFSVMYAEIR